MPHTQREGTMRPCGECGWCRFNLTLHGQAYASLCQTIKRRATAGR